MLSREKVIDRFGKMPETAAEARTMTETIAAEMDTSELLLLIAKINTSPKRTLAAYIFGKQVAEREIASRSAE